jgi:Ca2+-binding EF-hand superfamily protein
MTVSAIGQGMSMSMLYAMQKPSASNMVSKILGDLDTDGDGALSTEEIGKTGKHAKDILGADADGDGVVTQDELLSDITKKMENGMMPPPPPMGGMQPSADDMASHILDELDTDGDGALSTAEINSGGDRAKRILNADTNGDGIVTKNELVADIQKNMASNQAAMQQSSASDGETSTGGNSSKKIDPADTNKDGVVSMTELIAYLSQTLAGNQTSESQLNSLA